MCEYFLNWLIVAFFLNLNSNYLFVLRFETHTSVLVFRIEVSAIINTLTHIILTFNNELSYQFRLLRHFDMLVSIFTLKCIRGWVSKYLLLIFNILRNTFNYKVFLWRLKNYILMSDLVDLSNLLDLRLDVINFIIILLLFRGALLWLDYISKDCLLGLNKRPENFVCILFYLINSGWNIFLFWI